MQPENTQPNPKIAEPTPQPPLQPEQHMPPPAAISPVSAPPPGPNVPPKEGPVTSKSLNEDSVIGMTGSQLLPQKVALPKGLFVIAIVSALGFVGSFFDNSQNNILLTLVMLASLLLTIGLFLRLEMARKIMIFLSVLTVIMSAVVIVLFMMLHSRVNDIKQKSDAVYAQLEGKPVSPALRQELDGYKQQIETANSKFGRSAPLVYAKWSITILAYTAIAIYLARPKVKGIFRTDLTQS